MAKNGAAEYAALAKDRWDTLTIGVDEGDAESTNSELIDSWMASTRELLGRMIHGSDNDNEYTLLTEAEHRILEALGDEAFDLVNAVEALRAEARKVAAA